MSDVPLLRIVVAGHTNTGKTSLKRTLLRDPGFGEVSDRPGVTRHIEESVLSVGGREVVALYDTPGLEDSIRLLERLDYLRRQRREDWINVLEQFLTSETARQEYPQECRTITQVLRSDLVLYVIDVREGVQHKYRDELEIFSRCARPVVPVLNFTASSGARTPQWRQDLARLNMHAVAEFDAVVFSAEDERRLFEKMRTLLDSHREVFESLIADREGQRKELLRSSALTLADLLIDVAAYVMTVDAEDKELAAHAMEVMRNQIRERETQCVQQLLASHRFRPEDVQAAQLPIEDGAWGTDLFSPQALTRAGIRAGSTAAAGAMVGLTLDAMFAGLSLGTGTAAGAAIGALYGAARSHGRRVLEKVRGLTELRADAPTVRLLASRQLSLVLALLQRGHASMAVLHLELPEATLGPTTRTGGELPAITVPDRVMKLLARARLNPRFSHLGPAAQGLLASDPARQRLQEDLANALLRMLHRDEARGK